MTLIVNSVAIRERCQVRYLAGKLQDFGPGTFRRDLDMTTFGHKLSKMKRIYAGLSFLCIYFLVPALAHAHSFSSLTSESREFESAHASVRELVSKSASCLLVRSAECSKRTMLADGVARGFFALTIPLGEICVAPSRFQTSFGAVDSISFLDGKHALRTGLSPPRLS